MSSGPEDFQGLKRFIAIRMSDSDMGGRCNRSLLTDPQYNNNNNNNKYVWFCDNDSNN